MRETDDVGLWLPVVDEALKTLPTPRVEGGMFHRDISLWTQPPTERRALSAVQLRAQTLVRERWRRPMELSEQGLAALLKLPAPPDVPEMRDASFRQLCAGPGAPRPCTGCSVRKGKMACSLCDGTGQFVSFDEFGNETVLQCTGCERGWNTCSLCDGTARCVDVEVEFISHAVVVLNEVLFPELPAALAGALREHFVSAREMPEALSVRLDQRMAEGPYRASAATFEGEFHGHAFGTALRDANHRLAAMRESPSVLAVRAESWARPFVWLRYRVRGDDVDVAITREAGTHHVVEASAP